MDQLAPAIAWTKKNIFWLSCGVMFVAMVAMWFVSTMGLADLQKKNESDVKSKITMVEGIMRKKPDDQPENPDVSHPNQSTEAGMDEELSETLDAIVAAWRLRVEAQEEILVWPDVIGNEKFKEVFGRFNPAETFPNKYDVGVEALLSLYRRNIVEHMNNLCGPDLLRTNWKLDPANMPEETSDPEEDDESDSDAGGFGAGGGIGGGRGASGGLGGLGGRGASGGSGPMELSQDLNQYAVIWSDVNQNLWVDKLTRFKGLDDHSSETDSPTPLQCYMLQQDLWLLEAMFKIIRSINGDANANDLAVIKEIDHIAFGREAVKRLGELSSIDTLLGPGGTGEAGEAILDRGEAGDFGGDEEAGDLGRDDPGGDRAGGVGYNSAAAGLPPFHRRYVNLDFEPLTSEQVLAVIKGQELPADNLELIIAKRVPVRLGVKMDERRIADFMAACANSPFAFEISQVRINKHDPEGEDIPLGGFGADGTSDKFDGMGLAVGGGGIGGPAGGAETSKPVEIRTNYDVNVEFFGIVKIYNPVREDLLRQAAGLEETDSQPAGTPAATESAAVAAQRDPES